MVRGKEKSNFHVLDNAGSELLIQIRCCFIRRQMSLDAFRTPFNGVINVYRIYRGRRSCPALVLILFVVDDLRVVSADLRWPQG